MRKPAFCICENKDADQLRSNCAADQHICFRNMGSAIPLLYKSEISRLQPCSAVVQPSFSHNEAHLSNALGQQVERLIN